MFAVNVLIHVGILRLDISRANASLDSTQCPFQSMRSASVTLVFVMPNVNQSRHLVGGIASTLPSTNQFLAIVIPRTVAILFFVSHICLLCRVCDGAVFAEVTRETVDTCITSLEEYPPAAKTLVGTAEAVNRHVSLLNEFRAWHFGKWNVWMCGFEDDIAHGMDGVIVTTNLESSNAIIRFAHRCALAVFNMTSNSIDICDLSRALEPSRKKKKRKALFLTGAADKLPDEMDGWTFSSVQTEEDLMMQVKDACPA